jgi:hypothetical protein
MNELDFRRQQLIDSVAHDGVRLSAAHFHDGPRFRGELPDFGGQLLRNCAVSELREVLHE